MAVKGGMQASTQPGLPTQLGSRQLWVGSLQLGSGTQPETMMLQDVLHMRVPAPRPSVTQVAPPKSVPSHCSPGSMWPLPQRLIPPVPELDELAAPPVPLPPVAPVDELLDVGFEDVVVVDPPACVVPVPVPRSSSPCAHAANTVVRPSTVAVNLHLVAIVVSKERARPQSLGRGTFRSSVARRRGFVHEARSFREALARVNLRHHPILAQPGAP